MIVNLDNERMRRAFKSNPELAALPLGGELSQWDIEILAQQDEATIEAFFRVRRRYQAQQWRFVWQLGCGPAAREGLSNAISPAYSYEIATQFFN